MKNLLNQITSSLLLGIFVFFALYLLFLTDTTGSEVDINERWFQYGASSVPVSDPTEEFPLAFSLLAPAEFDEAGEVFYWLTENGDLITISNLSNAPINASFNFELSSNPCKFDRTLVVGNQNASTIYEVSSNDESLHSFDFSVDPGVSEFFSISSLPGQLCKIDNGDSRNFVAKLSTPYITIN